MWKTARAGTSASARQPGPTWLKDSPPALTSRVRRTAPPKGSIVVAFSKAGTKTEQPHLGALSHENTVAVPGFPGKVVAFTTDDSNSQSELYMYVANSEADFIAGQGKLYVLKTDAKSAAGNPLHAGNLAQGQSVVAYFVEISDPADLSTTPNLR
jgi:hypothetical protein